MGTLKRAFGAVIKPILREVTITSAEALTPRFVHLVLEGRTLGSVGFTPGDKLQVFIDGDFRTYTPFGFDARAGRCELLVYLHGDAPGAAWARAARAGDRLHVFGPRGSLAATGPVVLVGDETSLGVGRALTDGGHAPASVLEVGDRREAKEVASAVGLAGIAFVERAGGDGHLAALEAAMREALSTRGDATLLLTGRAQTIQTLRSALRARPAPHDRQRTKAYWAPGKRGLD